MKVLTQQQATEKLLAVLPADIQILSDLFTEKGFDLFLVGGCVRDAFMNKNPKDFDVATNALPEQVIEILTKANITNQLQGADFGVVVARMSEDIEIATFRTDVDSGTGSNKETKVTVGVTIEDDVQRRDLTINALFMNLETHEIIDLVGGIKDLNDGIIRTVGEASQRFAEDNLRKLRAIRFATRLGFQIEDKTFQAIKNDPSLNVSAERIVNELQNAFETSSNVDKLIIDLFHSGLIFTIFKNIRVKDLDLIDTTKITSFTTFVAEMIDDSNKFRSDILIGKELNSLKFSSKLIAGIETLLRFDNIHTLCPIEFTSKLKSTSLTSSELCNFHQHDLFLFAFDFKFSSTVAEDLMTKGFRGKELGLELKRLARIDLNEKIKTFTKF